MTRRILCHGLIVVLGLSAGIARGGADCHDASCGASAATPDVPGAVPEVQALLKLTCEHAIPTYTCDECRYEVGVVKVVPELLDAHGGARPLVNRVTVRRERLAAVMDLSGELRMNADATVVLTAPVEGIIREVSAPLGTRVETGRPVATMASPAVNEALRVHARARSLAELSQRNVLREEALQRRGASPEADLIEARLRHEELAGELAVLTERLESLGLPRAEIAAASSTTGGVPPVLLPLRAPLTGTVVDVMAAAGKRVDAGAPVLAVSDLSTLWVWMDVYEQELALLTRAMSRTGLQVHVETKAYPGRTFPARLDSISPTLDEGTRTVKARAVVDNADGLLKPGMFCQARVQMPQDGEGLVVPATAVLSDEGRDFVFKALKDDYYLRWPVRKGRAYGDRVEIEEGLNPGEQVVDGGAFLLKSDVLREKMGAGCAD